MTGSHTRIWPDAELPLHLLSQTIEPLGKAGVGLHVEGPTLLLTCAIRDRSGGVLVSICCYRIGQSPYKKLHCDWLMKV